MDASGSTREGWMTFIPLTVLLFIIIYVMGGPTQFVNVVAQWTVDVVTSIGNWIKHL
jgi:predicted membrane-bound dolichyl-phosphate-mannose-protein mannosyltransferase